MTDELYTLKSTGQVIEDPRMSSIMWWLIENQPHCNINYTWDDIGMAQLLVDCYKSEIRYCYQNGCWYTWAGCWRKQKDSGVVTDMFQTMLNLLNLYPGKSSQTRTQIPLKNTLSTSSPSANSPQSATFLNSASPSAVCPSLIWTPTPTCSTLPAWHTTFAMVSISTISPRLT